VTTAQATRTKTGAWVGGGARPRKSKRLDICCFDCLYTIDRAAMLANGGVLRCGSTFLTSAMCRGDMEIYQPHFDAECVLTPTIQGLWARYRHQPALADQQLKRAILIDSSTGVVHERTWGEKFPADVVVADTFVVEIFDSLCGYVGMEIYRWGRPEPGMWVQGQVRPHTDEAKREAWLRSTYADRAYIDQLNAAVRPLATARVWPQAEADMRRKLLKAYALKGLV